MKYEMKAVYQDKDGNQFSYPVVKTANGWKLSGLVDIVFYLTEATAAGGLIEFVDYVLEAPPGIRGCDYIQINNAWRVQLPWPQKPAEPPTTTDTKEDPKLHVERGSNWAAQKQAYAEQRLAQERRNRDQARAEITNQPPDPYKVQAARELNAQILHQMRPRGRGVGLVIEKE